MFYGICEIRAGATEPYDVKGTWLYKPQFDTWYCNGHSYPAECVVVKEDLT